MTMAIQYLLWDSDKGIKKNNHVREFKLCTTDYYQDPGNTLYAAAVYFSVKKKHILRWSNKEAKLKKSSEGSKHCCHAKRVFPAWISIVVYHAKFKFSCVALPSRVLAGSFRTSSSSPV